MPPSPPQSPTHTHAHTHTQDTVQTGVSSSVEEEQTAPNQNDPKESEKERSIRLSATHADVIRAKADKRWLKSTKHCGITLSLYSKSKEVALFVSNLEEEERKKDGAVVQMRWDLDLVYAVWLTDEPGQQSDNVCFNIVLCDAPVIKSRTYSGAHMWRVIHAAPPIALSAMSTTHAYLRAEINRSVANTFVSELRRHYSPRTPTTTQHVMQFNKPSSRAGWKKYNDQLLLPIRAKHYERITASYTTALGLWLKKWSKLNEDGRRMMELDPW